ncbi:hypothetical protein FEM48_Zijuj11G0088200 [Ziziphus jujuba var. spinosa]|uniref:Uncharacterized protein n=1 Tax=Ziziphus jujuba var. spinosa TaxID=714518 RepID=A0A978UHZ3_ZIZJJ|nr:hypothetical protein FEM48_Zijuj11G0088200 [Ziziphus jujuba var. spinosa]
MEAARHFASVEKGGPVSSLEQRAPMQARPSSNVVEIAVVLCIEADGTVTKAEDLDNLPEELKNTGPADAYCKCGEGWSCVVSRIEDPTPAAKPFYECAGSCSCVTE